MEAIIFGVIGSIIAVILWEAFLKSIFRNILRKISHRNIWKKILDFTGDTVICKSKVKKPKVLIRASDIIVEEEILKKTNQIKILKKEITNLGESNVNIIVIGSIMYNKMATEIQKMFDIGFEYIQQAYDSEPTKKILKIINKFGDEYTSSEDIKSIRNDFEIDYGILFLGNVNGKKILWISGIHGIATIGVVKFFSENPETFDFKNTQSGVGKSWLFRIKYRKGITEEANLDDVLGVEVIQTEKNCKLHQSNKNITTIIFDFGNVIMFFDRLRTYRGIAHLLKLNYKEVQNKIEKTDMLRRLEHGKISSEEYYLKIMKLFPRKKKIEYSIFREIFGDIFWTNINMIETLKQLKRKGYELILLSNTNEIHFTSIREHYQDILSLFDKKLILSYEVKTMKPEKAIYEIAVNSSSKQINFQNCIFIDDKKENISKAIELGMEGINFYKHSQLIYELRKKGIYID